MEKPKTLIETILASKALSELKKADLITFVGPADADMISPISNKVFSAKNYSMEVKGDSAFIILNNRNGGLKDSVASQWPWFVEKCNSLEQNNLFVILQNEVNSGFKDSRELDAFYSVLEGVVNKGKNVYLISSDWTTNSQRRNGIRYITTGNFRHQFYNSLLDHIVSTKYILITISEYGVTYELKIYIKN